MSAQDSVDWIHRNLKVKELIEILRERMGPTDTVYVMSNDGDSVFEVFFKHSHRKVMGESGCE